MLKSFSRKATLSALLCTFIISSSSPVLAMMGDGDDNTGNNSQKKPSAVAPKTETKAPEKKKPANKKKKKQNKGNKGKSSADDVDSLLKMINDDSIKASDVPSQNPILVSGSAKAQEGRFCFLRNEYPHLVNKPFELCYEEKTHYDKLNKLTQGKKSPEEVLLEGAKDELTKGTLHYYGPEHEKHVLNQMKPKFDHLQKNHPRHGYFGAFFDNALKNHTQLEDLLWSAKYMYQTVEDEGGGTVLFLGRTPCVLQVAYEELLKSKNNHRQVPVHLNFSGHPDALTKRQSYFFRSETNIARDIVTPKRLSHYFRYLDSKDILKSRKLFISDIIGTGGSLVSFIEILKAYFEARKTKMPALQFLTLAADVDWSINRSKYFTFKQVGEVCNRGILTIPEDKRRNVKLTEIPVCSIPIFDKLLTEMLDQDMFQEFCVHGIQYPASKWTPQFDQQREEGGKYHRALYTYLRKEFSQLIRGQDLPQ